MIWGQRPRRNDFTLAHPYKKMTRELGLTLYILSGFTGVSESKLSRCLNRLDPMPLWLEEHLAILIDGFRERERKARLSGEEKES